MAKFARLIDSSHLSPPALSRRFRSTNCRSTLTCNAEEIDCDCQRGPLRFWQGHAGEGEWDVDARVLLIGLVEKLTERKIDRRRRRRRERRRRRRRRAQTVLLYILRFIILQTLFVCQTSARKNHDRDTIQCIGIDLQSVQRTSCSLSHLSYTSFYVQFLSHASVWFEKAAPQSDSSSPTAIDTFSQACEKFSFLNIPRNNIWCGFFLIQSTTFFFGGTSITSLSLAREVTRMKGEIFSFSSSLDNIQYETFSSMFRSLVSMRFTDDSIQHSRIRCILLVSIFQRLNFCSHRRWSMKNNPNTYT